MKLDLLVIFLFQIYFNKLKYSNLNIDIYEIPKGNANAKCFYESKDVKIICSVYNQNLILEIKFFLILMQL